MEKTYWFEATVRYDKMHGDGTIKKACEKFLIDAVSYTEAEKRITEEMAPFISGEFSVDIAKRKYSEVVTTDTLGADTFYRCKTMFATIDEKTGVEKFTTFISLIQAKDFDDAVVRLKATFAKSVVDYIIAGVAKTEIAEVYKYKG